MGRAVVEGSGLIPATGEGEEELYVSLNLYTRTFSLFASPEKQLSRLGS